MDRILELCKLPACQDVGQAVIVVRRAQTLNRELRKNLAKVVARALQEGKHDAANDEKTGIENSAGRPETDPEGILKKLRLRHAPKEFVIRKPGNVVDEEIPVFMEAG